MLTFAGTSDADGCSTPLRRAFDTAGCWGDDHVAWSWAFVLEPVEAATTRLLVRVRVSYRPAAKWGPVMWLLVEPAHFVMGRRQLPGFDNALERPSGSGRIHV